LPNLNRINARLSVNSRRVEAVVDSQLDGIERLFSATTAEDWKGVAEAARLLAQQQSDRLGPEVIRAAQYVFEELAHATHATARQPKHLDRLLAACRLAKMKRSS
jgi:hypothetical protein